MTSQTKGFSRFSTLTPLTPTVKEAIGNTTNIGFAWYQNTTKKYLFYIFLAILIIVGVVIIATEISTDHPVLYMTTHNGSNVLVFDAIDGSLLSNSLFDMSPFNELVHKHKIQWRGIIKKDNAIIVANSQKHSSFIAGFSCCDSLYRIKHKLSKQEKKIRTHSSSDNNNINSYALDILNINVSLLDKQIKQCNDKSIRDKNYFMNNNPKYSDNKQIRIKYKKYSKHKRLPFSLLLSKYSKKHNMALIHPYGMAWHEKKEVLFVTTQDTHSVLLLNKNGDPHKKLEGMEYKYPGAIKTYKSKKSGGDKTVRGIAVDTTLDLLFVANEINNVVLVYDINNSYKNIYNITNSFKSFLPVGVLTGEPYINNSVFIGDRSSNNIYAFYYTKHNYSLIWKSKYSEYLVHPTGIALSHDTLYVISKGRNRILSYSANNGDFIGVLNHFKYPNEKESNIDFSFKGEQLLYLPNGGCIKLEK